MNILTNRDVVFVHLCARFRIVVLIHVKTTIATTSLLVKKETLETRLEKTIMIIKQQQLTYHENISILRQMSHTPYSRFMSLLRKARETWFRVLCAHVKHPELALKGGDGHLIHLDVLAVKLDIRHTWEGQLKPEWIGPFGEWHEKDHVILPLATFVSYLIVFVRKSNNLTSPLS